MKLPPMDPWAPGVRAADVPIVNGSDPNPLDTAKTSAPLCPNKTDISRHLYTLFPAAFVQPYPDAWIEIAFAKPATGGNPNAAEHFSAFELQKAADFAEEKNKAGFNILRRRRTTAGQDRPELKRQIERRELSGEPLRLERLRRGRRLRPDQ